METRATQKERKCAHGEIIKDIAARTVVKYVRCAATECNKECKARREKQPRYLGSNRFRCPRVPRTRHVRRDTQARGKHDEALAGRDFVALSARIFTVDFGLSVRCQPVKKGSVWRLISRGGAASQRGGYPMDDSRTSAGPVHVR